MHARLSTAPLRLPRVCLPTGTASYYTDTQNVDDELRRTGSLHVYGEGFQDMQGQPQQLRQRGQHPMTTSQSASSQHSVSLDHHHSTSTGSRSQQGDERSQQGEEGGRSEVDSTFHDALARLSDDVKDNYEHQSNVGSIAGGVAHTHHRTIYPGPGTWPSARSVGSVTGIA